MVFSCTRTAALCFALTGLLPAGMAFAEPLPYSETLHGALGLNVVPSARMQKAGSVSLGVSTLDPYLNTYLGLQMADRLSVTLRQTALMSSLKEESDRLYPGVDLKLRLAPETRAAPEIALGLQSALGHKRMAGEYLALSKRWLDFDFTGGVGWGRYAGAGHIDNPLKSISGHFGKTRPLDGELPNTPEDWFTGEQVGLFAGVEYFTSVKGLSLKLDWGADRYEAEQAAFDYKPAAPWSVGLNYRPAEAVSLGLAAQGTDKIMGRISLHGNFANWKDKHINTRYSGIMRPYRTGLAVPARMTGAAATDDILLYDLTIQSRSASARLRLDPDRALPAQIGEAVVHMANHAGPEIEEFIITPTVMGLQGSAVRVMRRDFESALIRHQGSASEIWRNTEFRPSHQGPFGRFKRFIETATGLRDYSLVLENQISLAEEDSGILYRTSVFAGARGPSLFGFLDTGGTLRLNLSDNLEKIREYRPRAYWPVRSDEDIFAERAVALENLYAAFTHSLRSDLHMNLTAGYMEEMYAAAGGEVLYRPLQSRFAVGAEAWLAFKRDPYAAMNMALNGDHLLSGHVNLWYDVPRLDLTLKAQFGRYLAEDLGGSLGFEKTFRNGARLEAFATLTDQADYDLFGGSTHAYHGLRLSLPMGGFEALPRASAVNVTAAPFGRDIGQSLKRPFTLYEITHELAYPQIIQNWDRVLPPGASPY